MGISGDWGICPETAASLAERTLDDFANYELAEMLFSSPYEQQILLEAAKEAGNDALMGMIGAAAYLGATISKLEEKKGFDTVHNTSKPEQYLRNARSVFTGMDGAYTPEG